MTSWPHPYDVMTTPLWCHHPYDVMTPMTSFHENLIDRSHDLVLHADWSIWVTWPISGFLIGRARSDPLYYLNSIQKTFSLKFVPARRYFFAIKGTVSRYCACTKLWFLDRIARNQKMLGEWENLEKSVCIALCRVQYYSKTSQDYRSMIYCSC